MISAEFDTHLQLVGWHPDQAEAERIRAAMQTHHGQKPEQPDWQKLGPIEPQAARTALTEYACGIDAERCRGFLVAPVEWLDVLAWGAPAPDVICE